MDFCLLSALAVAYARLAVSSRASSDEHDPLHTHFASAEPSTRTLRTLVRDPVLFAAKRAAVVAAGVAGVHFVVDFDRTLTTNEVAPGERGATCHGIVEQRRGADFYARARALNDYYYPREIDSTLSHAERTAFMVEWYAAINAMIAGCGLTRAMLAGDVAAARFRIRRGMAELVRAAAAGAMVTIFSAGIGDVIEEVLAQRWGSLPENIRVVSNWMRWESGACVDFSPPLIHVFNKSAAALGDGPHARRARACPAVVLLGDSEGDPRMADGLDAETVLRIGFLNARNPSPEALDMYSKLYDVVLIGDAPAWSLEDLICDLVGGATPGLSK